MLFLAFLIFRAVSIEFRSKEPMLWWRRLWDTSYFVSSIMLAVLLGVVLGNVLQGFRIGPDYEFVGHWLEFINPYALMTGATTLSLFMMHGALYLLLKTEGRLYARLSVLVKSALVFFLVSFSVTTLYTLLYIPHLSDLFKSSPAFFFLPALAFLSIANIPRLVSKHRYQLAFLFSAITISLLLVLVAVELYPVLILSTLGEQYSITVYNAASSERSLRIMLIMAAIGTPLVISYTVFVFWTFRGKVKMDETSY
jgi:cytochrome d ubiquinol oxidase subunit II